MLTHELILERLNIVVQVRAWAQLMAALHTATAQVSQDVVFLIPRQLCYHGGLLEILEVVRVLIWGGLPRLGIRLRP